MKLMFASDLHGSLPATEKVLERFAHSGAKWGNDADLVVVMDCQIPADDLIVHNL